MLIRTALRASFAMVVLLAIEGCEPKTMMVKTDPCAGWSPIYASKADTLTDGTAKQILAHDCHGIAVKCWKDPTPKGKPPVCPKITR